MRYALSSRTAVPLRCWLGTLIVFTALNLPYRFSEYAVGTIGDHTDMAPSLAMAPALQSGSIFGGWPLRYVSLIPRSEHRAPAWSGATWSLGALFANGLIALAAAMAIACVVAYSPRFAMLGAGTCILALLLWSGQRTAHDLAVSKQLALSGTVYRSAVVPVWVNRLVPSYGMRAFSRARGVMLQRVEPQTVEMAVSLPELHSLGFRRSFPGLDQLQPLMLNPRLHQLAIFDAPFDDSISEFIATQTALRHLEVAGCRGLSGGFLGHEGLTKLHTFDATNSDLPLAGLTHAPWAKKLRHLRVSHAESGFDTLELRDYRKLRSLTIRRRSRTLNSDPLTVSLQGVPQLRIVNLGTNQKLRLSIVDAPRLKELRMHESEGQLMEQHPYDAPGSLWLESLRLVNTPSLEKLSCYGLDLRQIEIRDAPKLRELVIDSSREGHDPLLSQLAGEPELLSTLINDLAACDGPPVIDLSTLPLHGVDLTPLTHNERICELRLASTGINGEQLKSLLTLPRLRALDVRFCPISNAEVTEVLQSQPQLKQFRVHPKTFQRIEVIDRDQLVTFVSGPSPLASVVRICGSPQLDSELVLGDRVRELVIQDGNSLQGISINGPIPPEATLEGLSALRFCALGGPNVDDRLCESLWNCLQLKHLTLAHTNVTPEALSRIGCFEQLSTLMLPGSDLDDSVTRHWSDLRHLRVIDLSHTRISTETLSLILACRNLQRLSLNHVDLTKADLRGLDTVVQLFELEVAGIGLEAQALETLLARGMLDRLDISDCALSPEVVQVLASGSANGLVFLGLQNCGLSETDIRSILAAQPLAAVDIEGNPLSDTFRQELRESDRLLSRRDRAGFLRRVAQRGSLLNLDAFTDLDHPEDLVVSVTALWEATQGVIDTYQFAAPLPVTASR